MKLILLLCVTTLKAYLLILQFKKIKLLVSHKRPQTPGHWMDPHLQFTNFRGRSILGTSRGKLKVSIVLEIFQYRYTSQIITSPGNNALSVLLNYSAFCPNSRGCPGLEDYLPRKSWLDRAMIKYGGSYLDSEVEEVKILGKIIVVFLVLIPYWSIYYQVMYCMCTESCCAYS